MKLDGSKIRLIHDLSFPALHSVNGDIDPEDYLLYYASVDDAINFCSRFGSPFLAKLD